MSTLVLIGSAQTRRIDRADGGSRTLEIARLQETL